MGAGGAVALTPVLGAFVLVSFGSVAVSKVPRFSRSDGLAAPPALDAAGGDLGLPCSAQGSVLLAVPTHAGTLTSRYVIHPCALSVRPCVGPLPLGALVQWEQSVSSLPLSGLRNRNAACT